MKVRIYSKESLRLPVLRRPAERKEADCLGVRIYARADTYQLVDSLRWQGKHNEHRA